MLTIAITLLVACIMLILLNILFEERLRWARVSWVAFLIILLVGVILGMSAYWLRSGSYHEALTFDWLQIGHFNLSLVFAMGTPAAYVIGFFSLFMLVLCISAPKSLMSSSFNHLVGLYALYVGLILAGDLFTLLSAWLWGIALTAMVFSTSQMMRRFSPWLSGGCLFMAVIMLINHTNDTLLPDAQTLAVLPTGVAATVEGLIITVVLLQACQLPFPLWMEDDSETESKWLALNGGAVNMVMGSVILLWKFAHLLQSWQTIILACCGFLTLLWAFYRSFQPQTLYHTRTYLFINGLVGASFIGTLVSPSPVLIQLISLLPVILLINTIPTNSASSALQSPSFINNKGQIGLVFVLLLITGAPLTITYNLRLSVLAQLLSRQTAPAIGWLGLGLWFLGSILMTGLTIHWLLTRNQKTDEETSITAYKTPKRSWIVLGLNVLMLLYLVYPLPINNQIKANTESVLHLAIIGETVGNLPLTSTSQLNILTLTAWILPLLGFLFYHQRLVLPASRFDISHWLFDSILTGGVDWLSSHIASWADGFNHLRVDLTHKILTLIQQTNRKVAAPEKGQKESENQSPIRPQQSKALLWSLGAIVLAGIGLVLWLLIKEWLR